MTFYQEIVSVLTNTSVESKVGYLTHEGVKIQRRYFVGVQCLYVSPYHHQGMEPLTTYCNSNENNNLTLATATRATPDERIP